MPARSVLRIGLAVTLVLVGCGSAPQPEASATQPAGACSGELPPRTSPTDFPVAVLHVNGEDLPPIVGSVEWLGAEERVTHEPARDVHLQTFTVLQTSGQSEVSLRMTDGVAMASWTIDAVPGTAFRRGDFETDRVRWSEGNEPTDLVCVPIEDGEWGIVADVTFADAAGTGTYYFRLNVVDAPTS